MTARHLYALVALCGLIIYLAGIYVGTAWASPETNAVRAENARLRAELARCEVVAARATRMMEDSQHRIWTWLTVAPQPKRGDLALEVTP